MSILHPSWLPSATQIQVWNDREWLPRGTGIVIRDENGQHFLATARHVVDEQYAKGPCERAPYEQLRILNPSFISFGSSQDFVEWDANWSFDPDENDLAVTSMPDSDSGFYRAISTENILNKKQLEALLIGHPLIMSGFPGLGGIANSAPLLVTRQGVLATFPKREIEIENALGRNYFLMDSFAQSGFSGAPLFSFERPEFSIPSPIRFGGGIINGEKISESSEPQRYTYQRIPAGLAGIICGHFRSALDRSDGGHAGLSYCVPAHRIIALTHPNQVR
jgi:hypothetical protein